MTKPWEETWEFAEQGRVWLGDVSTVAVFEGPEDTDVGFSVDDTRAKLAAAAPDMARLLMRLLSQESGRSTWYCLVCRAEHSTGSADCELVAVLRKAGVR